MSFDGVEPSLTAVRPLALLGGTLFETSGFRHVLICSDSVLLQALTLGSELMFAGPFSDFVLVFLWQLLYGLVFSRA